MARAPDDHLSNPLPTKNTLKVSLPQPHAVQGGLLFRNEKESTFWVITCYHGNLLAWFNITLTKSKMKGEIAPAILLQFPNNAMTVALTSIGMNSALATSLHDPSISMAIFPIMKRTKEAMLYAERRRNKLDGRNLISFC